MMTFRRGFTLGLMIAVWMGCGGGSRSKGAVLDAAAADDGVLEAGSAAGEGGAVERDEAGAGDAQADTVDYAFGCTGFGGVLPVIGVEYCPVEQGPECSTTDSRGLAQGKNLPANSQLLFTAKKRGYVSLLKHVRTTDQDGHDNFDKLLTQQQWESWAREAKVELDDTRGHIAFYVFNGGGASVVTRPEAGTRVYLAALGDGTMNYVPALDAATAVSSFGLFFNVEPGEYEVAFSHPEWRCGFGMETGWPASSDDASKVVVRANMLSWIAFGSCMPR